MNTLREFMGGGRPLSLGAGSVFQVQPRLARFYHVTVPTSGVGQIRMPHTDDDPRLQPGGPVFYISTKNSTGNVSINNPDGSPIVLLLPNKFATVCLLRRTASGGVWLVKIKNDLVAPVSSSTTAGSSAPGSSSAPPSSSAPASSSVPGSSSVVSSVGSSESSIIVTNRSSSSSFTVAATPGSSFTQIVTEGGPTSTLGLSA